MTPQETQKTCSNCGGPMQRLQHYQELNQYKLIFYSCKNSHCGGRDHDMIPRHNK